MSGVDGMSGAAAAGSTERLAVLTSTIGGGGAQRSMLRLAGAMADRGFQVDLVCGRAEGHYRDEVPDDVRIVGLDTSRTLFSIPALVAYLRRERPRAMLSSLSYVNIVGLWARRLARVPTRLVVNEQNTLSVATRNTSRWRNRLMPRMIGRFYPWADGVVAVSCGVADDLAEVTGLPREQIEVIHNPVVTPTLRSMMTEHLDHPWFRPGEPPVVLALGRFVPQKDFATLIEAFARVRRKRSGRLLILGEGHGRGDLERLVARLGLEDDVRLPGWAANPYPYMARSDLFVLSSRWEGLPTVLIEALFCGVPVISTDCPSGPREILQDGKYGTLVPIHDADALASSIAHSLGTRASRAAEGSWKPFEQETVAGRYLEALLGARAGAGA